MVSRLVFRHLDWPALGVLTVHITSCEIPSCAQSLTRMESKNSSAQPRLCRERKSGVKWLFPTVALPQHSGGKGNPGNCHNVAAPEAAAGSEVRTPRPRGS